MITETITETATSQRQMPLRIGDYLDYAFTYSAQAVQCYVTLWGSFDWGLQPRVPHKAEGSHQQDELNRWEVQVSIKEVVR